MAASLISLNPPQRQVLMALAFLPQPASLDALWSAMTKQGEALEGIALHIQALRESGMVEEGEAGNYGLTLSGLAHLIYYQTENRLDVGRVIRALKDGVSPWAEVLLTCIGFSWLLKQDSLSPAAKTLFSQFCDSPLSWQLLHLLPEDDAECLLPEIWLRHFLQQPYPRWTLDATDELELWDSDLLPLDWEADLYWMGGAKPSAGQRALGMTLTAEVVKQLDGVNVSSRGKHSKWGAGSLIDLAVVALFDMPLARARAEKLGHAMAQFPDQELLPSWYTYLALLTAEVDELEAYFANLELWCQQIAGNEIAWGRLFLDVLIACRLIDARPGLASTFEALRGSAIIERILASHRPHPLAQRAVAGLRHLLGHEGIQPFRNAAPAWEQWLSGLTKMADNQSQPEQTSQRLVWQLSQRHVVAKIQKRGKKGWSKGRQVSVDELGYRHAELISDSDRGVIGAIQNHLGRSWRDWREETELNVPLMRFLSKCDNIVDDNGNELTLYAEKPLVVLSAKEERLVLSSYPSDSRVQLYPKASNAVAFLDISESASAFLATVNESPTLLPVAASEQVTAALAQFGQLDWYSELNQQGSVSLGQWDRQPQLWLDWEDGMLAVSIEHQPMLEDAGQLAYLSYPSGKGPEWVPHGVDSSIWYQRDLKQELSTSLSLLKALGLKANAARQWKLVGEQAVGIIQALSEGEYAPIHWRSQSRQLSVVGQQDFELEVGQQQDWFALDGKVTVDKDLELNLRTLLSHHRTGFVTLDNGKKTVMLSDALRKQLRLLESLVNDEQQVDRRMAYPLQQLISAINHQGDAGWEALVEQWREKPVLAGSLMTPLREYQKESVSWAAHLAHHGFGACLADDMGLGKTLQALTLIRHFAAQGPSLVVAPKSVLSNWQQEAQRFAPELTIIDVEYAADRAAVISQAGAQDVILLSYGLLTRLDTELHEKQWQCAVLDEAQQIKNPNAKRSKIAFGLQAQCRFALSGTPVENHLLELWSLFSFLNPGLLGNRQQFRQKYANAASSEEDMLRLRALVSPFIMRRLKQAVLTELPAKTEITHTIALSKPERTAYEAVRKESVAMAQSGKGLVEVLASLTRLRQVCCDPSLVFTDMDASSSKLAEALQLVKEAREGQHRILVFSQFVTLLKRFAEQLDAKSIEYSYLDGKSSSRQRKQAIEAFASGDKEVFLISLKAGGTGLNLTQADTVIHLDPWWNPAVEDQASDRAYRMGQTKPVTVYRLVAANTIEEKIVLLHRDKRDLADKVLSGQDNNQKLSPELLLTLMED